MLHGQVDNLVLTGQILKIFSQGMLSQNKSHFQDNAKIFLKTKAVE